ACGGAIGVYPRDAETSMDASFVGADATLPPPETSCSVPAMSRPPARLACDANVRMCIPGKPSNVGCPDSSFAASLRQQLAACGVMCADLIIGVSGGCVTEVLPGDGAPDAGVFGNAIACAQMSLLGTGWACAPSNGWVQLVFGVCLTP